MRHFTEEQKKMARKADLYAFLLSHHAADVKREGKSLRYLSDPSISIKRGFGGYNNFSDLDDHGNSIDFLVKKLGYQIDDAVFALLGEDTNVPAQSAVSLPAKNTKSEAKNENPTPIFPEPVEGAYRQLFAYLKARGVSQDTIQMLVDRGLLYQEKAHNNIVFANKTLDWGEIRGTYTQAEKSFHGMVADGRHDGCWWFKNTNEKTEVTYICESAIDAISLYEMHRMSGKKENACYVSIGGASKQDAIDRIKKSYRTIIAVDNDDAGSKCRRRNMELQSIIPKKKDWNDDLMDVLASKTEQAQNTQTTIKSILDAPTPGHLGVDNPTAEKPVPDIPDFMNIPEEIPCDVEEPSMPEGWKDPFGSKDHEAWVKQMMIMQAEK